MYGSRDATRAAFKAELIENGDKWMRMIESRNQTSHAYDKTVAAKVISDVIEIYFPEFESFHARMEKLKKEKES